MSVAPSISDETATTMRPGRVANLLLWMILLFFVIFVAWAGLTEIDRSVQGQGRVISSSQLQVVSNLEGGIVDQILVQPGQFVEEGTELLNLNEVGPGSELASGQASAGALAAKVARLKAEVEGREPTYPPAVDQATAEQIQIERALHLSRLAQLSDVSGAARARIAQAERAVAEAEAAYQARVAARDGRRAEVAVIRPLVLRGVEARMSLIQAESAAAVASSEAAAAAQSIARARGALTEARATLAEQRQEWRAAAATELAAAQAELSARQRALPALADRLRRTIVRAPLSGRINRVLVTTVGSAVAAGAPLVEIVPSEETLLVEAMVRPQDIGKVHLDQPARVSITAYDPTIYGRLEGKVVGISPDAVENERTGETFYVVRVRTEQSALQDAGGQPLPIGPGMVADVSLLGEKRTVLSYLLTPITRLRDNALRE